MLWSVLPSLVACFLFWRTLSLGKQLSVARLHKPRAEQSRRWAEYAVLQRQAAERELDAMIGEA